MENPATWGPLEREVAHGMQRYNSILVHREESAAHVVVKTLYQAGHIKQHQAEKAERLVSRKMNEFNEELEKPVGERHLGLGLERQLADALRQANLVQERVEEEL